MLYGLNDITIIPAEVSEISHREECNPCYDGMLPLFAAPMTCVADASNYNEFIKNSVNPVVHACVSIDERFKIWHDSFVAFTLKEFEQIASDIDFYSVQDNSGTKDIFNKKLNNAHICIDTANGHMKCTMELCAKVKDYCNDNNVTTHIMVGNIANPETYLKWAEAGADYIRCSIGNGGACITAANTGVFYPMASLIRKCKNNQDYVKFIYDLQSSPRCNKITYRSIPKIVADGGFDTFDKIIKGLALGADYIMCGKIFVAADESCAEERYKYDSMTDDTVEVEHKYIGQSTKEVQLLRTGKADKTSEGIGMWIPVEYTLSAWCDNFKSYLRSAMSYTNCRTLEEFRNNTQIEYISQNAFNSYYK